MKKVLHITNWYPNKWNGVEAIFVQEQFRLFSEVAESALIHVEVRPGDTWFRYEKVPYSERETGYYIITRIKTFRVLEILSTLLLLWALLKSDYSRYDLLHFHIAYPLLTYYHRWKKIIGKPVIISEHWSAYHFNFYMPQMTRKLDRIKHIFRQHIPLISVSAALLEDIRKFAGTKDFPSYVIPNVIDHTHYRYRGKLVQKGKPVFFMVNFWRKIKNPFPLLEAFDRLSEENVVFELRIGGYGDLLSEMKSFVHERRLNAQTVFLGKMGKEAIADELSKASAYLFASDYETFSAACAQALSCGCPLIGPAIPAILEYAGPEDMVVLAANDPDGWQKAVQDFLGRAEHFNHRKISENALRFLSHEKIKECYRDVIS